METTAGVCERRQLARVYTTALCSRRPHRAVSTRAERTFLFVRTPRSLSVFPPKVSLSLLLSFSFTSAPFWQRQLSRLPFSVSPFSLPFKLSPFTRLTTSKAARSDAPLFCSRSYIVIFISLRRLLFSSTSRYFGIDYISVELVICSFSCLHRCLRATVIKTCRYLVYRTFESCCHNRWFIVTRKNEGTKMAVHFVRYSIKIDSIRSRDVNPANARLL